MSGCPTCYRSKSQVKRIESIEDQMAGVVESDMTKSKLIVENEGTYAGTGIPSIGLSLFAGSPENVLAVTQPVHIWEPPAYTCPKHGRVTNTITSNIKGHEGAWCQICWLETLGPSLPKAT